MVNPAGGEVSTSRVRIPLGGVVKVHLAPFNSDGKLMTGSMRTADPNVIQIHTVLGTEDVALFGVRRGVVSVDFLADGAVVQTVQAEVVDATAD